MDKSDVVIIGGVACGCKTAASLARRKPEFKITLFQKEKELSYGTCGLPYFASGDIDSFRQLTETNYNVVRDVDFFKNSKGFDAVAESEVIKIDRKNKLVHVKNLKSGETYRHGYGKLVIATGAIPQTPPIEFPESDRISHFTRPSDAIKFRKSAQTGQVGSALILGGGFIGCELAESCGGLWGLETTLVEKEPQLLPYVLDHEMSLPIEKHLAENDVNVLVDTSVTKVDAPGDDTVVVTLSNDQKITVDYLFICAGVCPASELAGQAGLELGQSGGIAVDDSMRTSDPDIYAGGDVVELRHQVTGQPLYIPMGSLANRHGRIIAENIAGESAKFPGALGAFMVKIFDYNVGTVGLSQSAAEAEGMEVFSVWGSFVDRPDYYPETEPVSVKIVVDSQTDLLLGVQAVGRGDVVRRIDVGSVFLQNKCKLADLIDFEHGYAPPYSEALDPLYHLATQAIALKRGYRIDSPDTVYDNAEIQLLDVREADEIDTLPFQAANLITIPLNDLRDNLDKLERNRPIAVLCHRGPRSYQAACILSAAGFEQVTYIGGGTTLSVKSLA